MVQLPVEPRLAVSPETPQTAGVIEAKLTVRPELADADSVSGVPTAWAAIAPKVIVCARPFTVKLCETGVAAAYALSPACVA
jgi:hypothetical protein